MGLTRVDPETAEVLPFLATSWDISEDGTVYTFHMRDDVPWVKYDPPQASGPRKSTKRAAPVS